MTFTDKLNNFAVLLEKQQLERLNTNGLACQANIDNCKVKTNTGKKFTKVDVGTSGKFMVENTTGNIYGIKGYGVVHLGHFYGTLDTTAEYDWSDYYPKKLAKQESGYRSCPKLEFANETERTKYYGPAATSKPMMS